jgi:tetratricopeptide (TPR) repeat protein
VDESFVQRISSLVAEGDIKRATEDIEKTAESEPVAKPVGEAIVSLMSGQIKEALRWAMHALELAQEDPVVLRVAALCHLYSGDKEGAERLARMAANRDVGTEALFTLGQVLLEREKFQEAERAFQRVLELEPLHHRAISEVGVCRLRQGDRRGALVCFARAFSIAPDDFGPVSRVIDTYFELGLAVGIISLVTLTRASEEREDVKMLLDLVALLLAYQVLGEHLSEGITPSLGTLVENLVQSCATQSVKVQLQIARILCSMKRYEHALRIVERLEDTVMTMEERAHLEYLRGLVEDSKGQSDEALSHHEASVKLSKERWDAACNALTILLEKDDAKSIERAGEIIAGVSEEWRNRSPQLMFNEAVYLKRLGRFEQAKGLFKKVQSLAGHTGELAKMAKVEIEEMENGE